MACVRISIRELETRIYKPVSVSINEFLCVPYKYEKYEIHAEYKYDTRKLRILGWELSIALVDWVLWAEIEAAVLPISRLQLRANLQLRHVRRSWDTDSGFEL